jgi:hypothetical protein
LAFLLNEDLTGSVYKPEGLENTIYKRLTHPSSKQKRHSGDGAIYWKVSKNVAIQ